MSSHPDAAAFLRKYLRAPQDATARLVFADWLEETGTPANRAWAHFIRLKAEADRHPPGSPAQWDLERQAAGYVGRIRARLTVPAALFVGYPRSLLQLLPADNLCVRLTGFVPPPAAVELVPEVVARVNTVVPLAVQDRFLLVAVAGWIDPDFARTLQFIVARGVVPVTADPDEIRAAIDRVPWPTESPTVEYARPVEVVVAFDAADRNPPPDVRAANLILAEARRRGADRARVSAAGGPGVAYHAGGAWTAQLPLPGGTLDGIAAQFARMAGATGEFRGRVAGDDFTVRVAIQPYFHGPTVTLQFFPPG